MGTSLTGNNISASYLGLLKSTDSQAISTSPKRITDGNGNDLPLQISTSQVLFNEGTEAAPSISFNANSSEGFYLPTDETLAISLGGNERVRFGHNGSLKLNNYGGGSFTGTVTQRLGVTSSGDVVEIPIGAGALDGAGSAGKIAKFIDTDTIGDSIISESSGTVTINLASNPTSLQIGSSLADDPFLVFQSDGNTMSLGIDRSDANKFKISDNTTLGTNDRLEIDTSGNINILGSLGLGDIVPTSRLEIAGGALPSGTVTNIGMSSALTTGRTRTYDTSTLASIGVRGDSSSIELVAGSSTGHYSGLSATARGATIASGTLIGYTYGAERFRVDADGDFGINTTNPLSTLHVKTASDSGVEHGLIIERSNVADKGYINYSGGAFRFVATDGDPIKFGHPSSTDRIEMDNSGNLGIGVTPSAILHVFKNTTDSNEILFENDGTGDSGLTLRSDDNGNGNTFSFINFDANDSANNNTRYASIFGQVEDNTADAEDGQLLFTTLVNNSEQNQLKLNSSGATFNLNVSIFGNATIGDNFADAHVINGATNLRSNQASGLTLINKTNATAGTENVLDFRIDGSDNNEYVAGMIGSVAEGTWTGTSSTRNASLIFKSVLSGNNTERMRLTSAGRLGIGVTVPSYRLEILGDSQVVARFKASNNSTSTNNGGALIDIQNTDSTNGNQSSLIFRDSNGNGSSGIFGYHSDHSDGEGLLTFGTRDSSGSFGERVRIDSSGNVGVGLNNPSAYGKFIVKDSSSSLINLDCTTGSAKLTFFENGTGRFGLHTLDGSDGLAFVDGDGSSERARFDSSGRFFLGHTSTLLSSSEKFSVSAGTNGINVFSNSATGNGTLYLQNTNTSTTDWQTYLILQDGIGNRGQMGIFYNTSTLGIGGQGGIEFKTGATSLASASTRMKINSSGALQLNTYGSGTHTGTTAKFLAVDSSGNVIESTGTAATIDGSGTGGKIVKWSDSDTIGDSIMSESGDQITLTAGTPSFKLSDSSSGGSTTHTLDGVNYTLSNLSTDGNIILSTAGTGKIGIGTSSIDEKLQVEEGNIKIEGGANSSTVGLIIAHGGQTGNTTNLVQNSSSSFGHLFTTDRRLRIEAGSNGSTGTAETLDFFVNGSERMMIDTTGRVGIGESSPNAQLHVVDDGGNSVTAVARFRDTNTTAKTTRLQLEDRNGSICDGLIDLVVPNSDNTDSYLGIGHNDSKQLVLANGGNVGIGGVTTTPLKTLDVVLNTAGSRRLLVHYDDSLVSIHSANGSANAETLRIIGDTIRFNSGSSGTGSEAARILSNNDFVIGNTVINPASGFSDQRGFGYDNSTGNVEIGTTGDAPLTLGRNKSADGSLLILRKQSSVIGTLGSNATSGEPVFDISASSSNGHMRFLTNGSEAMRIIKTQLVGIGKTPSTFRLEVESADSSVALFEGTRDLGLIIAETGADSGLNQIQLVGRNAANSYNEISLRAAIGTGLVIDTSNNIGIGTNTPSMKVNILHSDQDGLRFTCADGLETFIDFGDTSDNDIGRISYDHADNHMAFRTNNSKRLKIDSSGDVSIINDSARLLFEHSTGTDYEIKADGTIFQVRDTTENFPMTIQQLVDGSTGSSAAFLSTQFQLSAGAKTGWGAGDVHGHIQFHNYDTSGAGARNAASIKAICTQGNGTSTTTFDGALAFFTSDYNSAETETVRFTEDGNVLVGKTTNDDNTTGVRLHGTGILSASRAVNVAGIFNRTGNTGNTVLFRQGGTQVGTISVTTTSTSYNTSGSDERLKKNISDWNENVLDKFKDIKPKVFNYNEENDNDEKTKGFIAQNEIDKFPEAYPLVEDENTGEKRYWFNPSGMNVYLMKAIQELKQEIDELKKEI